MSSMYEILRKFGTKVDWARVVWDEHIPPKYSFCHWLLRKDALKTKDMLNRRGMSINVHVYFVGIVQKIANTCFLSACSPM